MKETRAEALDQFFERITGAGYDLGSQLLVGFL
jgi:hypothetical protein